MRILLVENERILGVLTKLELEDLGYEVLEVVTTGREAIRVATDPTSIPDLILMDIELDGDLDGIATAEQIRRLSGIPIVFVSGKSDEETIQRCLSSKPYGYVRKPCTREDLDRCIEIAIRQQQLNRHLVDFAGSRAVAASQQVDDAAASIHKDPVETHDTLTGLKSRSFFLKILEDQLKRNSFKNSAIVCIDIDRFGRLNDTQGRAKADLVLQLFAARLESHKWKRECISRIGADEFAILINGCETDQDALDHAIGIQSLVMDPFWAGSDDIYISVSSGVVRVDPNYQFAHAILRDAEAALHQAKKKGVGSIALFNRDLQTDTARRFKRENDLRRALDRNELAVFYQPIVDVPAQRITGFEALLRWRHPEEGLLEAADIISIAEESGLILPIGRWVLERSCEQLAEWQNTCDPALSIHVNLSVMHLFQRNLIEEIQRILNHTGIDPATLKVEITENFVMKNSPSVIQTLLDLQAIGIGLQIDDFGTGYSSLSYLHQFPINAVKIDKSFIERAGTDPAVNDIITMIVQLTRKLNLEVIAEGVETSQQLHVVHNAGCELVQGYYFSVPVDSEGATRLLKQFHLTDPKQTFAA